MNCIIVDDDEISRKTLEHLVRQTPDLVLTKICTNAVEAFSFMQSNQVDLVLLDIMMPGMTGMELVKSLGSKRPEIILITSEKQFASDAFDYDVADFITKPVSSERFYKALGKVMKHPTQIPASDENSIFIKAESRYIKINLKDIFYVEALADYMMIYTDTQRYVVHSTMKNIEEKLPAADFLRVHNSYVVRMDKISAIEDNSLVINSKVLPISRNRKKELMDRLKLL